jgi:hypothetical protein
MALQFSVAVRNARLNSIESSIGTAPILRFRTGTPPANVGSADSGSVLASLTLPSDWLDAAASGQIEKLGTWEGNGSADGDAGHFRLYASDGTTAHMQGTVTATGGGGDMTISNINIAVDQPITVTAFTITDGNA